MRVLGGRRWHTVIPTRWLAITDGRELTRDGENGLRSTVFDGKNTGSKWRSRRTHLGSFVAAGKSQLGRAACPGRSARCPA